MFYSETGAMLKVNFFNDAADFDVVTGEVKIKIIETSFTYLFI